MLAATDVYPHLLRYVDMAAKLQEANLASDKGRDTSIPLVNDPLCQNVTIYDCVERRYAGFSNALQQVRLGSENPKTWQADDRFDHIRLDMQSWLYVYLVHRITGSGASFQSDHGFRNSIVADLTLIGSNCTSGSYRLSTMKSYVRNHMRLKPIFTSIGNQIPAFPKPVGDYKRGGEYYLHHFAPQLCNELTELFYRYDGKTWTIKELVDWVLDWHTDHGLKRFKFVLTAFVMDIAEYHPRLVDPASHCYFGANAVKCCELAFDWDNWKGTREEFHDASIDRFREDVKGIVPETPAYPMSLEDVLCDGIRWMENYIPKGYEDVPLMKLWSTAPRILDYHSSFSDRVKAVRSFDVS